MEFRLDAGQVELQQTVDRFFADRFPLDGIAEREGAPVDRARLERAGRHGRAGAGGRRGDGRQRPRRRRGRASSSSRWARTWSPGRSSGPSWPRRSSPAPPPATGSWAGSRPRAVEAGTVVVEHAADLDVLLVVDDDGVVAHRTADLAAARAPAGPRPADPGRPVRGPRRRRGRGRRRGGRRAPAAGHRPGRGRARRHRRPGPSRRPGPTPSNVSSSTSRSARSRRSSTSWPTGTCATNLGPELDLCGRRGPRRSPGRRPRPSGVGRQAPRHRGGPRRRRHRGAGPRRDGLHLGHAPQLPAQAGLGAGGELRLGRRPRPPRGLDVVTTP